MSAKMKNTKVTVKIPRPLYEKIKVLIEDSGFSSPTDFIVYVLRDLVGGGSLADKEEFTHDEIRAIKQRLKNLGYLD